MTKIDIISGFLGAGKTTLIRKLIQEAYQNEKLVLIENEFGEIGIDGDFLKDAGIAVKEMNSGCICCSLVGDFAQSLTMVMDEYAPDRIIIEPSGVGKLSDVIQAVTKLNDERMSMNSYTTVVDAKKVKTYSKNFGEFFNNQIAYAKTIVLSRTQLLSQEKLNEVVSLLQKQNPKASLIVTPWEKLDGEKILNTMEHGDDMASELLAEMNHHHDEHCCCGQHHEEEHCCGEHDHHEGHCSHEHHHDHDHEHCSHEHHHEHGPDCTCGCHDHEHHHADEVFTSWGMETPSAYSKEDIEHILEALEDEKEYGFVLRAKGMVPGREGGWVYFDYVPGESNVREGKTDVTGKFCVIGSELKEDALGALFAVAE